MFLNGDTGTLRYIAYAAQGLLRMPYVTASHGNMYDRYSLIRSLILHVVPLLSFSSVE